MDAIQLLLLQLKQGYIDQLADRFDQLETLVLQIESNGFSAESYNELFRQVHSLKGSGGTHNLQIITNICHPLEDYLSTINAQTNLQQVQFANIAFAYIDLLRDIGLRLQNRDETFHDIDAVLAKLRARSFAPRFAALIVENSTVLVKILSQTLEMFNFRIVTLDDGYQALGRALVEPFDLIISGNEIRQLNGTAMLAALKLAHGINSRTRTIMLSASRPANIPALQPNHLLIKDDQLSNNLVSTLRSIMKELE